jgi:hypothetical protein
MGLGAGNFDIALKGQRGQQSEARFIAYTVTVARIYVAHTPLRRGVQDLSTARRRWT